MGSATLRLGSQGPTPPHIMGWEPGDLGKRIFAHTSVMPIRAVLEITPPENTVHFELRSAEDLKGANGILGLSNAPDSVNTCS